MGKFVVVYVGGAMGETPEEQEASMNEWMSWFGSLGSAVTDMGNPFMSSTALEAHGVRSEATSGLSGYSIIEAENLDDAANLVAKCPILTDGGSLELYEAHQM
jgi:hypothetical protein